MLFQVRLDLPLDGKWKHFCNFPPHSPCPPSTPTLLKERLESVCVCRAKTLLGEWGEVLHLPNIPAVPAKQAQAIAMAGEAASFSWGQGTWGEQKCPTSRVHAECTLFESCKTCTPTLAMQSEWLKFQELTALCADWKCTVSWQGNTGRHVYG